MSQAAPPPTGPATESWQDPRTHPVLRIGVSSCLLGEPVRFDGQHKRDAFVTGVLAEHVQLIPVCPEVAIGLGIPREPIRLTGDAAAPRAVGSRTPGLDVTDALADHGRRMARELGDISGYVFKNKSPSCGKERVKVYHPGGGRPAGKGTGIYAAELMRALPLLPVEEEGRLHDPGLRESFFERVFAYRRWQSWLTGRYSVGRLVAFHERHKLALMAHGAEPARRLGRIVGEAKGRKPAEVTAEYGAAFMAQLARRATPRSHTNVLHHLMGYLKQVLDEGDKAELLAVIDVYRRGEVPLIVPLTLLRYHFRRNPHPYVAGQTYLNPYPAEWILRSGI